MQSDTDYFRLTYTPMPIKIITYRHIISALLLALYLLLPAQSLVHAAVFTAEKSAAQSDCAASADPSCPACPCSGEQDSGCCESSSCSCSFHAPPAAILNQTYAPMVTIVRLPDPYRALPQVYGSIFVPPQNLT